MEIANKITKIRELSGLNKREFAEKLKIAAPYVSQIENGARTPSDKLLDLIMQKFDVSTDWWKTGEGPVFKIKEKPEIPEHLRLLFRRIEKVFPDSTSLIEKHDVLNKVMNDLRDED